MRHRKGFNHLGRTSAHRKAMLANMATSLILHKRITTTTAKAKALRSYVEPLITRSKEDTTHSRRVVFSYLKSKFAVTELFREIAPKIADRPGGYTRILKTGNRLGDNADMCVIELVDYNENLLEAADKKSKSTRRRRGSGKKKTEEIAAETTTDTAVEDTTVEETEAVADTEVETPAEEAKTEEKVEAEAEAVVEEKVAEEPVAEAETTENKEEASTEEEETKKEE